MTHKPTRQRNPKTREPLPTPREHQTDQLLRRLRAAIRLPLSPSYNHRREFKIGRLINRCKHRLESYWQVHHQWLNQNRYPSHLTAVD